LKGRREKDPRSAMTVEKIMGQREKCVLEKKITSAHRVRRRKDKLVEEVEMQTLSD